MNVRGLALAAVLLAGAVSTSQADEGMWTFDHVPVDAIRARHGVTLTQEWLDRVRLATVRLETGCTGSFISPDGLILTNHHCVEDALVEHSKAGHDLYADGFLARTRGEELPWSSAAVSVLIGMRDITPQVNQALAGLDPKRANEERKRVLTRFEKAGEDSARRASGRDDVTCETVTLYQGGMYMLYTYKRYDDVRLVFAPEFDASDFGGDPDNFQYPRWDFDVAMIRVYENGRPAHTPNYLPIRFEGPRAGEPVFVSGHPGTTDRLLTVAQLRTLRDVTRPTWMLWASELRGRYLQYGKTGAEAARRVNDPIQNLENTLKVRRMELVALDEDSILAAKRAGERELARRTAADPKLARELGDPWRDMARAQADARTIGARYAWIEGRRALAFRSDLYNDAVTLVRAAAERAKPNESRLREYAETALPRLRQRLLAPDPRYPDVEELGLSFSLERMREYLGPDDALVHLTLGRESPDSLAARLVRGTRLGDAAERKRLWDGGAAAVNASHDPMIEFARKIDPEARRLRKTYEDRVEAPVTLASERIARARFAVYGTRLYPDATFTLRLNDGTVAGWNENGVEVKPFTTFAGAVGRATGQEPFIVPKAWTAAHVDPNTPYNLSTTNDIVGGNSGSPLIDAQGRLVGCVFDGNIYSIAGSYWFDPRNNRTVAVHPAMLREALHKVYRADELLREMGGLSAAPARTARR